MAQPAASLPKAHIRRLRELYRSAGWPSRDGIEAELLAGGFAEQISQTELRVTQAGLQAIAAQARLDRARAGGGGAHAQLSARVAHEMALAGRVVFTELSLRAAVGTPSDRGAQFVAQPDLRAEAQSELAPAAQRAQWHMVRPDVYSLRITSKAQALEPLVHEVKVSRADLLSDLKRAQKRAAYAFLGSVVYVLKAGIAEPSEIPPECGVVIAHPDRLELIRATAAHTAALPFQVWLALARASPVHGALDEIQSCLKPEDLR